jgi:O-antigen/teichoic acid export membrane protein
MKLTCCAGFIGWKVSEQFTNVRWRLNLKSWVQKSFLAVFDQALFSGANFLVNVLLARKLPPEEYGAFAVALSIYYLLLGFHTAVITEPMMVFGAGKYREQFHKYFGMVLWGHWGISVVMALGLWIAGLIFLKLNSLPMGRALLGLAISLPFLLLFQMNRRGCYTLSHTLRSVIGSVVNLFVVFVASLILWGLGLISSLSGLLILGIGAGISSLFLLYFLRPSILKPMRNSLFLETIREHWIFGRWNLLSVFMYLASGYAINFLVPIFLGLETNALLQAVSTLFLPLNLLIQSSSLVILPSLASLVEKRASISRQTIEIGLLLSSACLLYSIFIISFYQPVIVPLLFRGKYSGGNIYAMLLGLNYVVSAFVSTIIIAHKAYGDTKSASFVWGISACVFSILAIPSLVFGKLAGILITPVVAITSALLWAIKALKKVEEKGYGITKI